MRYNHWWGYVRYCNNTNFWDKAFNINFSNEIFNKDLLNTDSHTIHFGIMFKQKIIDEVL